MDYLHGILKSHLKVGAKIVTLLDIVFNVCTGNA